MNYIIGIDLGGTKINAVLINKNGKVIKKVKTILKRKGKNYVIEELANSVSQVSSGIKRNQILGVGIGMPGPFSKDRKKTGTLPNLPSLSNLNLKEIMERKLSMKVKVENDANCAALGEFLFGQGRKEKVKNMILLTLGTGLGGGIIIDGKLYAGKGNAGEIGHTTIQANGLMCRCGNSGCLEEYVSKRGLARIAEGLKLQETDALKIQRLAESGNKKAKEAYEIFGKYLGIGISNIVKTLDPEIIVLSGGISKGSKLFLKSAEEEVKARSLFPAGKILASKLLDDSGALGAAALFLD